MDLSRKIFLASCVCVTFLATFIGCSVEDRDIESAGIFICRNDDDCFKGSECVKAKKTDDEGRCSRSEEVKHCNDADGDGYIGVTVDKTDPNYKNYIADCGFGKNNLMDPDDSNPTVYPGAPELCDGVDNSGDGCVDGTCPCEDGSDACSCVNKEDQCKPIEQPCWGGGAVADYNQSVCSAALIGYKKCIDGILTYVAPADVDTAIYSAPSGLSSSYAGTDCPVSTSDIPGYDNDEKDDPFIDNNIDDNCNGSVDERNIKCSELLAAMDDKKCVAITIGNISAIRSGAAEYSGMKTFCDDPDNNISSCDCLGEYACPANDKGEPFCKGENTNVNIQTNPPTGNNCLNAFN